MKLPLSREVSEEDVALLSSVPNPCLARLQLSSLPHPQMSARVTQGSQAGQQTERRKARAKRGKSREPEPGALAEQGWDAAERLSLRQRGTDLQLQALNFDFGKGGEAF